MVYQSEMGAPSLDVLLMCFIGRESGNFVYISRLIYSGSLHDLLTLFIICTLRGRVEAEEEWRRWELHLAEITVD